MDFHYECYENSVWYKEATTMPFILENGRKVFGPPLNYNESLPSPACELYITHIPSEIDERRFLVWLRRIGQVFKMRLMMDTGSYTRGYSFIRFTKEIEALAAQELLKYLFVNGERLNVQPSQDKSRLYISGIPRHLPIIAVEHNFKLHFPNMKNCTIYAPKSRIVSSQACEELNRGYAFIEFPDHEEALKVKKKLTPGRVRMWGVDLKVQWAKPKEELNNHMEFWRNHNLNDYCAKLRLYCLANNWCIPVILYGRSFRPQHLQYAGVLLKHNCSGEYGFLMAEVTVTNVKDIHLILCELMVNMVQRFGSIPPYDYIFRVCEQTKAEMVLSFKHDNNNDLDYTYIQKDIFCVNAIQELCVSLQLLAKQNPKMLLSLYQRSFVTNNLLAKLCIDKESVLGRFYAVLPKFRNNPKLNNNFNDSEITLSQMYDDDNEQLEGSIIRSSMKEKNYNFATIILKSQQFCSINKYQLRYVDKLALESRECYHPAQRINSNPVWIPGKTYQEDLYNAFS